MKKILLVAVAFATVLGLTACTKQSDAPVATATPEAVVETFSAEYVIEGTTSNGAPKIDTFVFEGETTEGIITKLNFDIIRNKGIEGELSKKDIMGYQMNVSDAKIEKDGDNLKLTLTSNGYDEAVTGAQFMMVATTDNLTNETTFKDLTFTTISQQPITMEEALISFGYIAKEAKIENFNEDTLVSELVTPHGSFVDGSFVEGNMRTAFSGYNGGRSYGEQIDAIATHILNNKMTLQQVYEMFQTVNQQSTPIMDRDVVTGATIAFVGDFQRMVYLAINGELFEGVVTHTVTDGVTVVEVVTQGYAGEIETHVSFDAEGKISSIAIRDAKESDTHGAKLTAEGSEFIASLIAEQADLSKVDAVSGVTVTSEALKKAVDFAKIHFAGL